MKLKNILITILMTIFFIMIGIKVEAGTGTIKEDAVKLKKSPDSKTVLELLNKGDQVEILEEQEGFYKIKAKTNIGNITGYVASDSIDAKNNEEKEEPQIPQEEIPTVSNDVNKENIEENQKYILEQEVSIKTIPVMSAREKAKINGAIEIIETINDWSRIENDTEIGWIRTNILQNNIKTEEAPIQPENENKPEEVKKDEIVKEEQEKKPEGEETTPVENVVSEIIEMNKTGYVKAEGLRVRKGPSTDTEEITSLSQNDEVKIVGQTGKWYKIDMDGKTGYVSAKYISDTKIVETTSRSGSTLKNEENVEVVEKTTGSEIVEYAKKYLGYKYVSGGSSPESGFDCSGFTTYIYKHFGISLNRTSSGQNENGVAVEKKDLQLGDLVIFNNDANTKIGHVGIYVGDGNFIHASNPSDGVKITTLTSGYYYKRYVGARRVY